jgi:hypothetical protein
MDEYMASNRRVWDAWTKIHLDSAFYDVKSFRSGERPVRILDYELEEVGDVTGKTLLHLQCHFGLDTLSWARLGAIVSGADFSPEALQRLGRRFGSPSRSVSDPVSPTVLRIQSSSVSGLPALKAVRVAQALRSTRR